MAKPVESRQLRYFSVLAEELNFGRAARRLGMLQPPLSRQIKELERSLSASLLERTKHAVQLTAAGRVFLEETRRTLEQVSRSVEMAQRAHRGELGQLALGVAPLLEASAIHSRPRRRFLAEIRDADERSLPRQYRQSQPCRSQQTPHLSNALQLNCSRKPPPSAA